MDCRIIDSQGVSFANEDLCNFDCNICFELPQDPIVTPCGHLYCWPCLCQWLRLHSHFHECPICKATVHVEKLIPIYGRGKPSHDPRSHPIPGVNASNQHTEPIPQTSYHSFHENNVDPLVRLMPMAAARLGHATLSKLFTVLPLFFNLQINCLHIGPNSPPSFDDGDFGRRRGRRYGPGGVAWMFILLCLGSALFLRCCI